MFKRFFFKGFFIAIAVVMLFSCDKDFNTIGVNIVGDNHFDLSIDRASSVKAFSQNYGAVQSNNLPINPLGIYENPVFGKTTANFVTQLSLAVENPIFTTINIAPRISSVKLRVPYFSTLTATETDGSSTFRLDSIYGATSEFKLKVFENGFLLRDLDPSVNFTEAQKYYTNQNSDIDAFKGVQLNTSEDVVQNDAFFFDENEIVVTTVGDDMVETTSRTAPSLNLDLNLEFFKTKILEAPAGKLVSNNVFKNYFRGLYFQVEQIAGNPGNMAMLNFAAGTIVITYDEQTRNADDEVVDVEKTLTLNLTGNTVSLQNFEPTPLYSNGLTAALNPVYGQEKLFIKGGTGSLAVIELFGSTDVDVNGVPDELDELRAKNWLINEANLVFYVDKESMLGSIEPNRVLLYDLNNKRPIIDYFIDGSINGLEPKLSKIVHGGILETETTGDSRGVKYKIRLTNHISNVIRRDSTNVRLGLIVTETINLVSTATLKNAIVTPEIKRLPTSSVMNPLGTILYGSSPSVPEDKRLKLEIYYTKPN